MQPLDILKLLRAHFYDRDVSCGLTGTVLLIQATNTSRSVVPQLQKCSEGNNCIYAQLIFDKSTKTIQWRSEREGLKNGAGTTGYSHERE